LSENDGKYEDFIEGLTLVNIGLKSCSATLDRVGLYELYSDKKEPKRLFQGSYMVTKLAETFFEAAGLFVVAFSEERESKPPLSVECEFEAHIHGIEPISKDFVERFVASEFQLILVPYVRQFVSALTAQMCIPPVVLPLSPKLHKKSEAKKLTSQKASKSRAKR
jgi:preprotein translocase subunit SecB